VVSRFKEFKDKADSLTISSSRSLMQERLYMKIFTISIYIAIGLRKLIKPATYLKNASHELAMNHPRKCLSYNIFA